MNDAATPPARQDDTARPAGVGTRIFKGSLFRVRDGRAWAFTEEPPPPPPPQVRRPARVAQVLAREQEHAGAIGDGAVIGNVLPHVEMAIGAQGDAGDGDARAVDAPVGIEVDQFDRDAALRQARTAEGDCRRRDQQARQHLSDVRDQVAALGPPKPGARLAEAWQQMVEWAARTSAEQGQRLAALRATADRARDEHAAALTALRERAVAAVGAAEADTVARLQSVLAAARATADGQAKQLKAELTRIAKAREQIDALRTDARVAQLLGDVLKANRFESWLLLEAVEDLVARATVRLHELTGGQYSIVADERAFRIVDHRNADEERDARSLSGGETFLTSLALALALADSTMELAADGSGVLDSIFLDEGFGSLDPDTLDVVAGSIEELGASGRMVGIVTHIRELAERMPTRFEVTKGAGGSSVKRVDA